MEPNKNSYMMRLGDFYFSVSTAAFDKISYASSYRWKTIDTQTQKGTPTLQYIGPGDRTMTINGTIYPQMVKNGLGQVDAMREQAARGEVLPLCYVESAGGQGGVGRILGNWCISNISEERTLFLSDGNPREIQFTMELKSFYLRKTQ